MNSTKPVRMCVVCKIRLNQNSLKRFQILQNEVNFIFKNGRTMYLCNDCLVKNEKDLIKALAKNIKDNIDKKLLVSKLKERFLDGECKS